MDSMKIAVYIPYFLPEGFPWGIEKLQSYAEIAKAEVEIYCGRTFTEADGMNITIARVAANRISRAGTEGLASQSFSGVSESYIDGLPADIMAVLNSKRVVRVF